MFSFTKKSKKINAASTQAFPSFYQMSVLLLVLGHEDNKMMLGWRDTFLY